MEKELGSYLIPTTITGSFPWTSLHGRFSLPKGNVSSIDRVTVKAKSCSCQCGLESFTGTACAYITDERAGIMDMELLCNTMWLRGCGCCAPPYQVEIVYTSGFPNGFAVGNPVLVLGLSKAAELVLNQIIDPGAAEGGAGDPGVQSWGSLKHWETRVTLRVTAFGTSAMANWISDLVDAFKTKRVRAL